MTPLRHHTWILQIAGDGLSYDHPMNHFGDMIHLQCVQIGNKQMRIGNFSPLARFRRICASVNWNHKHCPQFIGVNICYKSLERMAKWPHSFGSPRFDSWLQAERIHPFYIFPPILPKKKKRTPAAMVWLFDTTWSFVFNNSSLGHGTGLFLEVCYFIWKKNLTRKAASAWFFNGMVLVLAIEGGLGGT